MQKQLFILMATCLFTSTVVFADQDKTPAALKTIEGENPDNPEHIQTLYKDLDEDGIADKQDQCLNSLKGSKVDQFGCEADTDKDGVFDRNDQCPNTTQGVLVNFLGCEGDQDMDKILDSVDLCKDTPPGVPVDKNGCTEDDDKDGVVNANDLCPDTPKNAKVNRFGCAKGQKPILNRNFPLNSIDIHIDPKLNLAEEANKLKKLKEDAALLITGHADSIGDAGYNMTLSWARAQKGKEYIEKQFGFPGDRIFVIGKGETEPVASNLTENGRRLNRRIEITVINLRNAPKLAQKMPPKNMKWIKR